LAHSIECVDGDVKGIYLYEKSIKVEGKYIFFEKDENRGVCSGQKNLEVGLQKKEGWLGGD